MIDQKLLDVAADWWVNQITGSKLNWDNGAQNEGSAEEREIGMKMWMMGNVVANNAREKNTPEQIEIFRDTLIEELKKAWENNERNGWMRSLTCSVDYHPGQYLYEAAEKAKIDTNVFPCKTVMWIDEKSVTAKLGYGAQEKELIKI